MPDAWFPNLGIEIANLPVSFRLFWLDFEVYYYGVFVMLGFVAGLFLAYHEAKRIGHDLDIYTDFIIVMLIVGVLGARMYYVLFTLNDHKWTFRNVFNIRDGGLAIYGGIIAVFFAGVIFAKKRKISFPAFADVCVPCVAVGQAIGRWGNFFNREVFGGYTENIFAMRYKALQVPVIPDSVAEKIILIENTAYIQVHPTFLYESLWNIALFFALSFFARHKKFDGQILLMYFAGYGIGRFWIEAIRTDKLLFFTTNIPVSQLTAFLTTLASVALIVYFWRRDNTKI